ncbi:MAG: hypothetical protein QM564_08720 [Bergeyella sp.]
MDNNNLPKDDLKKYGIIEADNSFTKKLSADEILKFLQGQTIVADNDKTRITFQLKDDNTRLDVKLYERDKNLSEILENSKSEIVFSEVKNLSADDSKDLNYEKKAFIFDKETETVIELDFIKNTELLTNLIAERKDAVLSGRYKNELMKLKEFLQEKIDKFPEIAKDITNDMNIVSKAINSVNSISPEEKQIQAQDKSDIQLNVNDPDLYQDANLAREHDEEMEEGFEREKPRGRGR